MARKSTVVIVALWTAMIAEHAWGAWSAQFDPSLLDFAYPFDVIALALPLVFFPIAAVCLRRDRGFGASALGRWIDAKRGAGTCDGFSRRLRPVVLVSVAAFLSGLILTARVASGDAPPSYSSMAAFDLSCAAGFALMQFIASRRGVVWV